MRHYLHFFITSSSGSLTAPRAGGHQGGRRGTRRVTPAPGVTHGDPVAAREDLSHRLRPWAARLMHTHCPLLERGRKSVICWVMGQAMEQQDRGTEGEQDRGTAGWRDGLILICLMHDRGREQHPPLCFWQGSGFCPSSLPKPAEIPESRGRNGAAGGWQRWQQLRAHAAAGKIGGGKI